MSRRGLGTGATPRPTMMRAIAVLAVAVGAGAAWGASACLVPTPAAPTTPTNPAVGALMRDGGSYCTGGVLHSRRGDLVVTAAHCLTGAGGGVQFVPGYAPGAQTSAPHGVWTAVAAYAPPAWLQHTDAGADVAVLRLAPQTVEGRTRTIEQVVGAGLTPGGTPAQGTPVEVEGYPSAATGRPRAACATTVATAADAGGVPSFSCPGFHAGTSGSPWVTRVAGTPTVVGVIGGFHQGGCVPETSYSSPLGSTLTALVARADAAPDGDVGDTFPDAGDDGC